MIIRQILNTCIFYRNCSTSCTAWTERIFSGIQPSGMPHLGNYLGAIRNWVHLQDTNQNVIFSIVDLHAITVQYDFEKLPDNILMMVACLLACGVDPNKSLLFLQSEIPQHTQLCWLLGCLCTTARLARMPQYREKSSSKIDAGLGLYLYPVLQAADILIYRATKVPVGNDQMQHLQLARELARKFNRIFGETFPEPIHLVTNEYAGRIKDLRNPKMKMSKSTSTINGRIEITDAPETILKKIKLALTDFTSAVSFDPIERPGVSNLIAIHSALINRTPEEICNDMRSLNTGQYKIVVAEAVIETLKPIREEVLRLSRDRSYLSSILHNGTEAASSIASNTWELVRKKTGIRKDISQ